MAGTKRYSGKTLEVLKALPHLTKQQRTKILRTAHKQLVKCICDCVLNTLNGNVKINDQQKKKLKRHQKVLREIGAEKGSWGQKKKVIVQSGGGFLLPLLTPLLGALLESLV